MLYENRHVFGQGLRLLDAAMLPAAAILFRAAGAPEDVWAEVTGHAFRFYLASLVVAFLLVADRLDLYRARRTESLHREVRLLGVCCLLTLALACLAVEVASDGVPGLAHAAVGGGGTLLLLASRLAVRATLRRLRRAGRNSRSWLLVGRNARAARIVRDVQDNPHYGIRLVGALDVPTIGSREPPVSASDATELRRLRNLGGLDRLRQVLTRRQVDEVVVTLPLRSCYDVVAEVLRTCHEAGISVKTVPLTFDSDRLKTDVAHLGDIPLVTHFSGPSDHPALALKRLLDLVVAGGLLIVLSPILLATVVAVRLGSRGPIFFRQTRVGLHGRRFTMLKFRTMVKGAEGMRASLEGRNEADGPVFKMVDDPRVTPIGRFLRRHHLDELPQLWNVVKGEMSLVGPRPPLPSEVDVYDWWQRRRLSMPPGLTCLWQVQGSKRHAIPFAQWVQLDLEYIDRWTLRLDLIVLARTVRTMLRGEGR